MEPSFCWINFFKGFNKIVVIRMKTLLTILLLGFPLPLKVYRWHAQTAEVMEPSFCWINFWKGFNKIVVLRMETLLITILLFWINFFKSFNKILVIRMEMLLTILLQGFPLPLKVTGGTPKVQSLWNPVFSELFQSFQ